MRETKRIVVKLGSGLLTEPGGKLSTEQVRARVATMADLASSGHEVVVVSSGAIAAGYGQLGFQKRPESIAAKQASAAVGQGLLLHAYTEAFAERELSVAQVLLTRSDFVRREAYNNASQALEVLIEQRVIPIINENDTVAVEEINYGDNDMLAALLAGLIEADWLLLLSSVDGLFREDPAHNPESQQIARVEEISKELLQSIGRSASREGTGGMYSKLEAAQVALGFGVPVYIGSPEVDLRNVIQGSGSGTYFGSSALSRVNRKRRWIAFHAEPRGRIYLDQGAVRALVEQKKSLLPAGVVRVEGAFGREDVVEVFNLDGQLVGKGRSGYSADELREVKGVSTREARARTKVTKDEVIHRDDWVGAGLFGLIGEGNNE